MSAITTGGRHVGDVQDHLTVLVGGHADLEAIEQMRTALASVSHLRVRDADDPIRRRTFPDLGLALIVNDQIVAQNLGQEPAQIAHLVIVDLLSGKRQGPPLHPQREPEARLPAVGGLPSQYPPCGPGSRSVRAGFASGEKGPDACSASGNPRP